jgi:nitrate reductase alpha subunit
VAAEGGYRGERGRGGFVRCGWEEATELIAAATVHAIRAHGSDRVGGFTPIPAMSPVSFAAGSRFLSLIGGHTTTFYDWYADLPAASPQVFGDQTDVPEAADWWDASYLIVWGTNLPITRTPDAHFMTEARYRGQKVVVVSPDYSDHVKFADDWLPAQPGTDAALAMAMGHVMLKEFWVDRQVPRFADYAKRFTDLPLLVALEERDGARVPGRFVMAGDLCGRVRPHVVGRRGVPRRAGRAAAAASRGRRAHDRAVRRLGLRSAHASRASARAPETPGRRAGGACARRRLGRRAACRARARPSGGARVDPRRARGAAPAHRGVRQRRAQRAGCALAGRRSGRCRPGHLGRVSLR